jgi:hypothetical protein
LDLIMWICELMYLDLCEFVIWTYIHVFEICIVCDILCCMWYYVCLIFHFCIFYFFSGKKLRTWVPTFLRLRTWVPSNLMAALADPRRTYKFDGHVAPSNLNVRTWVPLNLWERIRRPPSNLKTYVLNLKFDGTHVFNLKNVGAVELTSLSSSKNRCRLYSSVNPRSYGKFDGLLH